MITYEIVTASKSLRVLKKSLRTRRVCPKNMFTNLQYRPEDPFLKLILYLIHKGRVKLGSFRYDSDERGWRSRMKKRVRSSWEVINWSKGRTRGGGGGSN
ncbi:hypothetical protein Taro_026810 [Colocasia esculenta]|uniref:Uncharacterized protein n=1 Tax=Colocasia esculenta TaxID=4460 RepID=A0A843VI84_COLES|nr:hypothetical protein [Colocasia esculenta]